MHRRTDRRPRQRQQRDIENGENGVSRSGARDVCGTATVVWAEKNPVGQPLRGGGVRRGHRGRKGAPLVRRSSSLIPNAQSADASCRRGAASKELAPRSTAFAERVFPMNRRRTCGQSLYRCRRLCSLRDLAAHPRRSALRPAERRSVAVKRCSVIRQSALDRTVSAYLHDVPSFVTRR